MGMNVKRFGDHNVSTSVGFDNDTIYVVNVDGTRGNEDNLPEYQLELHNVTGENFIILTPLKAAPSGCFYHASGMFGYTTDSRFGQKIKELTGKGWHGAVHIHDQASGY